MSISGIITLGLTRSTADILTLGLSFAAAPDVPGLGFTGARLLEYRTPGSLLHCATGRQAHYATTGDELHYLTRGKLIDYKGNQ